MYYIMQIQKLIQKQKPKKDCNVNDYNMDIFIENEYNKPDKNMYIEEENDTTFTKDENIFYEYNTTPWTHCAKLCGHSIKYQCGFSLCTWTTHRIFYIYIQYCAKYSQCYFNN